MMQQRIICLILGCMMLLASCTLTGANTYDFSTAITQWELTDRDRPDGMVEDSRFEGLTYSRAFRADQLDAQGSRVGTFVGDDMSEREIVGFLLANYIVDADQHILATIYLMSEGRDESGYWANLVSEDPYWTNQENLDIYPFTIRIHSNGELWLHNSANFE